MQILVDAVLSTVSASHVHRGYVVIPQHLNALVNSMGAFDAHCSTAPSMSAWMGQQVLPAQLLSPFAGQSHPLHGT